MRRVTMSGDHWHRRRKVIGTGCAKTIHRNGYATAIDQWLPLTYAVNSLNRSMGQPDLYPFVLAPPVLSKLEFVHKMVRQATAPA